MCEFCTQHGEGKVWYLREENHSRELMEKLQVEETARSHSRRFLRSTIRLYSLYDRLSPLWRFRPFRDLAHAWGSRRQKKRHMGQVVPVEHTAGILRQARSIVRLPCVCRGFVRGHREERYCLGLGFDPWKVYGDNPDYRGKLDVISADEAIGLTEKFQREENLVHTVWTLPTPYVASLCSCGPRECGAMFTNYRLGINVVFPGELRAVIDAARCSCCGLCVKVCHFGAIRKNGGRMEISAELCQGCGLCRWACLRKAISLGEISAARAWPVDATTRGRRVAVDPGRCAGPEECGKCLEACPRGVFLAGPPRPGAPWEILPVLSHRCDGCGACLRACPSEAITV